MTTVARQLAAVWAIAAVLPGIVDAEIPTDESLRPQLVSEDPSAPSPYWLDDVRNCGPRCLQIVEHWFGGQRSFREISAHCPALRDGVPLEQVAAAARQLGWGVTPFTASVSQLSRLAGPAILHLERAEQPDANDEWQQNHFVVLLGHDPSRNEFLLFDPPGNVHAVSARIPF